MAVIGALPAKAFSDCEAALTRLRMFEVEEAQTVRPERLGARDVLAPLPSIGRRGARDPRRPRPTVAHRQVIRRLDGLWRMRLPLVVAPRALRVSHRMRGNDTETLSEEAGEAHIRVRFQPLPPVVVCRNSTDQIVEGSADLVLEVGDLALAGRYFGTIETTVTPP